VDEVFFDARQLNGACHLHLVKPFDLAQQKFDDARVTVKVSSFLESLELWVSPKQVLAILRVFIGILTIDRLRTLSVPLFGRVLLKPL